GFVFEFKQKASCLWGFGGEAPKVLILTLCPQGMMFRFIPCESATHGKG
ncbi:MAG: hypothetical protein HW380_4029, partial [Magnetococcales bacterium]|nr:hypothetical protein [Magnetococcales bacterium]